MSLYFFVNDNQSIWKQLSNSLNYVQLIFSYWNYLSRILTQILVFFFLSNKQTLICVRLLASKVWQPLLHITVLFFFYSFFRRFFLLFCLILFCLAIYDSRHPQNINTVIILVVVASKTCKYMTFILNISNWFNRIIQKSLYFRWLLYNLPFPSLFLRFITCSRKSIESTIENKQSRLFFILWYEVSIDIFIHKTMLVVFVYFYQIFFYATCYQQVRHHQYLHIDV